MKVKIDEDLLKTIAEKTGGRYFRATDMEKLKTIYDEINKLEKTEIKEFKYYNYQEKFRPLLFLALGLWLLEIILSFTVFRTSA
jgi:Ca-activated chloride channel family protein